jgi:Skp family chaperone for outer membrane proteins
MRRTITALTVFALLAGVSTAAAQTTPPPTTQTPPPAQQQATPPAPAPQPAPVPFPAEAKIAFISLQNVVNQSEMGKAGLKEMQTLTESRKTAIAAKEKEIQSLQAKADSQATVLTSEALSNIRRDLDRLGRELQFMREQAQADVELKQRELLESFQAKVLPLVETIRQEKGLWVIFAVQPDEASGLAVAAAHQGLDLTAEVVRRLNASPAGK